MARISKLENAEFAKAVAELYITGATREEMADTFGCHKDTITDWVRDPRVQAHAGRFAQERVLRIVRKTDGKLLASLDETDDPELLLKIRKEFITRPLIELDKTSKGNDAKTMADALDNLEDNPELAQMLKDMTTGKVTT